MTKFQVSVVIPVFNAAKYVRYAVLSAISQPQVYEVILVEDGSSDNSLSICKELESHFSNVYLVQHQQGINLGAGPSRNKGIIKACSEYIGFLDADDFMLPGRYDVTQDIFSRYSQADGVYEAVGTKLELGHQSSIVMADHLTTTKHYISPKDLFWQQSPVGDGGYCQTNGWTLRKSILLKAGLFNPLLRLHQDVDLFIKLSLVGIIYPGQITKPVAIRRYHSDNRITSFRSDRQRSKDFMLLWISSFNWAKENKYYKQSFRLMFKLVELCTTTPFNTKKGVFDHLFFLIQNYLDLFMMEPALLINSSFISCHILILKRRLVSFVKFT